MYRPAKALNRCLAQLQKTYYAKTAGIVPSSMRVVSIMPCTAKNNEARDLNGFSLGLVARTIQTKQAKTLSLKGQK